MSRIKYDLRPGTILDLRHYGAIELRMRQRHNAFLKALTIARNENPAGGDLWKSMAGFPDTLVSVANQIWKARHSEIETVKHAAEVAHRQFLMDSRTFFEFEVCKETGGWRDTDEARRMGIGDILIEIGICQKLADVVGKEYLVVAYDMQYPNAKELWLASGLNVMGFNGGHDTCEYVRRTVEVELNWQGAQVVPFRGHPQESALGGIPNRSYQVEQGYPGAQMLYELGWEEMVDWKPVTIKLDVEGGDRAKRWRNEFLDPLLPLITVQPVERTRENEFSTPHLWECTMLDLMEKHPTAQIVVGCQENEKKIAESLLPDCVLRNARIISPPSLLDWAAIVGEAEVHVTANNAGLWIGISMGVGLILVDGSQEEHPDYDLWIPKPEWFAGAAPRELTVV